MIKQLEEKLGEGRVQENVDLRLANTLRMSTRARYFLIAKTRVDLIAAKRASIELNLPLFIIGGGSNLVLLKEELEGLVVRNLYMISNKVREDKQSVELLVSSGYPVTKLVNETVEAGYSGFEYHLGLPGTVGGAIYMNSKWTNPVCYFGDELLYANLVDGNGREKKVERSYFQFAYDTSILQQTGEILLEAAFKLAKGDRDVLKEKAQAAQEYRKKTQPFGVASSGCIFRNVDGNSAGEMIDKAGLKGMKVGQFLVSPTHANFIINQGQGRPEDMQQLIKMIKDKVKEKFGVELKEEIIVI